MKYSAVVLRNIKSSALSVRYAEVTDALLSGGVFLDEIVFLPYDGPSALSSALLRLSSECGGVFIVADPVLLAYAKESVSLHTGTEFPEYTLEADGCLYAVLPSGERGAEIVRAEAIPAVNRMRRNAYSRVVVRTASAPAEKLRAAMAAAEEAGKGKLSLHADEKFGCTRIEVIYDSETPKMIADETVRILADGLSEYVYALEDVSVAQRLFDCLRLHRMRISTAESFTAGGVGRAIVQIPGASSVFYEGVNTYDSQSKIERLGVSAYTLKSKGAASSEVAYEMAAGLISAGHCDISVATTGVAGPQSDGTDKPVGLCFIAVGTKERVRVFRFHLSGDRETITETAVNYALFLAYKEIN